MRKKLIIWLASFSFAFLIAIPVLSIEHNTLQTMQLIQPMVHGVGGG